MNIKKIFDSRRFIGSVLLKIQDMSKEEQTDKVKADLYKLTQQFVYKYWRRYYPQYKGDVEDLVSDYYIEFLTPKSREKGKEQSLLDKFDPKVTTLPYLVKVAVQRKLIDSARLDKGEKNYNEQYDENTGDLSLDYISEHADDPDIQLDDIVFSEDEIFELRDLYDEMSPEKRKAFLKYYEEVKGVLAPNFRALFKDLVGDSKIASKFSYKKVYDSSISDDDWKKMVKVIAENGGSRYASSLISDKESAIARYVAGLKLKGIKLPPASYFVKNKEGKIAGKGQFSDFANKAVELGAHYSEIKSVYASNEVPGKYRTQTK